METLYVELKMNQNKTRLYASPVLIALHAHGIYRPGMTVEEAKAQWEEAKKEAEKEINKILDAHAAR